MGHSSMDPAALARQITVALKSRGFQAYLVGGCVRDLLLGREPADYDVSTDARPEQILEIYPGAHQVGAAFGVVLVIKTVGKWKWPPFAAISPMWTAAIRA